MLQGEREITLRFLAEPTGIDFEGKERGGAVMKWIDQTRYACTVGRSDQYCVTVGEGARLHAGLSAQRDRGVLAMGVKAVKGRRVGGCP